MFKFSKIAALVFVAVLVMAAPAMAQAPTSGVGAAVLAQTTIDIPNSLGVGVIVVGAAYGIGRLAGSALDAMARQPEAAGAIQLAMIIAAALIEGFTFFAIFICWG